MERRCVVPARRHLVFVGVKRSMTTFSEFSEDRQSRGPHVRHPVWIREVDILILKEILPLRRRPGS